MNYYDEAPNEKFTPVFIPLIVALIIIAVYLAWR